MLSKRAHSLLFALLLALGFTGGILFIVSLGAIPTLTQGTTSRPAQTETIPTLSPQGKELLGQFGVAFESAAAKVNPSVVPIFSETVQKVQNPFAGGPFRDFSGDDFFRHFFEIPRDQQQTVHSLGSGVIVSTDGYILTNNHVVKDADKVTVVLQDKKKYTAKVVGTDPMTDLAVIKIDAKDLTAASLGDSDSLRVGEWVIAVGNPFALMHTVTAGIISAVGRSSVNLADYEDFIQTDASINPGNSGGALSDLEGNVIAINTAIYSPGGTEGNIGIGFAIPVNMAKKVMHALIDKGKVARGYVGLYLQDLDDNLAKAMNLKSTNGALVAEVTPAGPADNSGVKQGDVVFNYDGKEIENTTQLRNKVAESTPGTRATFGILRGGKSLELTVVLGERPKDLASGETSAETPKENTSMKLGLAVQDLTPDVAKQLGYEKDRGVVITDVVSGSPADDAGLRQGDLIKEVNRANVGNAREFAHALANVKSDESVLFLVRRGQNAFFVAIQRS